MVVFMEGLESVKMGLQPRTRRDIAIRQSDFRIAVLRMQDEFELTDLEVIQVCGELVSMLAEVGVSRGAYRPNA